MEGTKPFDPAPLPVLKKVPPEDFVAKVIASLRKTADWALEPPFTCSF